jgi:hypothetical protein
MKTVPSHFVPLVAPGASAETLEVLRSCGVRVGERVEVDLEAVRSLDEDLAAALEGYRTKVQAFWDRYVATGSAGECVVALRPVEVHTKVDNKSGKVYLKDQVSELSELAGVGVLVDEVLGAEPDLETLPSRAAAQDAHVEVDGAVVRMRLRVAGRRAWSNALGGAMGRGEVARVFELKVSRAKSHDRRNQRLLEVKVLVEEVWPA